GRERPPEHAIFLVVGVTILLAPRYAVAVTDRRVLLVRRPLRRPAGLKRGWPFGAVTARRGRLSLLRRRAPDAALQLWSMDPRADAAAVASALGGQRRPAAYQARAESVNGPAGEPSRRSTPPAT